MIGDLDDGARPVILGLPVGDFALEWQPAGGYADLALEDDDLASDEGLRTAILLSLFTDRRAQDDDDIPAADGDRRGWWGDEFSQVEGDLMGSRLWLLDRSKRTPDILRRAEEIAREALAWLLEDAVADKLDVLVEMDGDQLLFAITVNRPQSGDPVTFRFAHAWDGEAAR